MDVTVSEFDSLLSQNTDAVAKQMIKNLVGRRTGIVRRLLKVHPQPDGPNLIQLGGEVLLPRKPTTNQAHGTAPAIWPSLPNENAPIHCGGAGATLSAATIRCLGEAAERYCAALSSRTASPICKAEDLPGDVIFPELLPCFSPEQYSQPGFPFIRPHADMRCRWQEVKNLISGKMLWVPCYLVSLPYLPEAPEALIAPAISTGLACGPTVNDAMLAGILEVVERDAVACTWLGQLSPSRIPIREGDLDPQCIPKGVSIELFELPTDLNIPVILVLFDGQSPTGRTRVIGTGSALSRQQAAIKAMREAAMSWSYSIWLQQENADWHPGNNFEYVDSFARHAQLYASPHAPLHAFDFMTMTTCAGKPLAIDDKCASTEEQLTEVIACFDARGIDIFATEITSEDVKAAGLHVVRAIAPQLQPLHGHHHLPFLGTKRLIEMKEKHTRAPAAIFPNPFPHPSA